MVAAPAPPTYTSPLVGYENAEPLPEGKFNEDGKSLYNPLTGVKSSCYDEHPKPMGVTGKSWFDFHIYYMQSVESEMKYGQELHERIRREFPEMRIYKLWDRPIGPHPVAMFEVNTMTPAETGALFSFLVVNRGPCSVLVHPNTDDPLADHTTLATWIGKPWPLWTGILVKPDDV